jgi:hypothetical protein
MPRHLEWDREYVHVDGKFVNSHVIRCDECPATSRHNSSQALGSKLAAEMLPVKFAQQGWDVYYKRPGHGLCPSCQMKKKGFKSDNVVHLPVPEKVEPEIPLQRLQQRMKEKLGIKKVDRKQRRILKTTYQKRLRKSHSSTAVFRDPEVREQAKEIFGEEEMEILRAVEPNLRLPPKKMFNWKEDVEAVEEKPEEKKEAIVMEAALKPPEQPAEPTRAQKREINEKIGEVYEGEDTGYSVGWDDMAIANVLKVPVKWVADIREEFYGPNVNKATTDFMEKASALLAEAKTIREDFDEARKQYNEAKLQYDLAKSEFVAAKSLFDESNERLTKFDLSVQRLMRDLEDASRRSKT